MASNVEISSPPKKWGKSNSLSPDRRIVFMFFETFFWFVCLVACLLACLFVCLFDMLSFLSETQFAYGPRAPRQSGYRIWGSYWHCQAGPPQACEQFHRKFKRDLWSRPVPTSGTGRKRFQVVMMIDNHLTYPTAPDMRLEAERQPCGSSKRKLHLLACLLLAWTLGRSP